MVDWKKIENSIETPSYEGTALSIRKNPDTLKWELIEIEYNISSGTFSLSKVSPLETNKGSAINAYKIRTAQLGHITP